MNFYRHVENQTISSLCSGDVVDSKILESDWLRAFSHISQEPNFSQIWELYKNRANKVNFHYRTVSEKINDQTF